MNIIIYMNIFFYYGMCFRWGSFNINILILIKMIWGNKQMGLAKDLLKSGKVQTKNISLFLL